MLDQELIFRVWHYFDSIVAYVFLARRSLCNQLKTLPFDLLSLLDVCVELAVFLYALKHGCIELIPPLTPDCSLTIINDHFSDVLERLDCFLGHKRLIVWIVVVIIVLFYH